MSTNENKRTDDAAEKAPAPAKETPTTDAAGKPKTGLNYVFKIAPADPKNSFDFEDVADK